MAKKASKDYGITHLAADNNLKLYVVCQALEEKGIHTTALPKRKGNDLIVHNISNKKWRDLEGEEFEVKTTITNTVSCDIKKEKTLERLRDVHLITGVFNNGYLESGFFIEEPFQLKAIYLTCPKILEPYWNKRSWALDSSKGSDTGGIPLDYIVNHSKKIWGCPSIIRVLK